MDYVYVLYLNSNYKSWQSSCTPRNKSSVQDVSEQQYHHNFILQPLNNAPTILHV